MRSPSLTLAISSKALLLEHDSPSAVTQHSLSSVRKTRWGTEHKKGLTGNASPLLAGMTTRIPSI